MHLCVCVCVHAIKRKRVGIFMPKTVVFKSQVEGVGEGKGGVDP